MSDSELQENYVESLIRVNYVKSVEVRVELEWLNINNRDRQYEGAGLIKIKFVLVIAWVAVKFGINITSVVLEMGINFTRRSRVKFTISNTTRVVFIPNFTATHAIPS